MFLRYLFGFGLSLICYKTFVSEEFVSFPLIKLFQTTYWLILNVYFCTLLSRRLTSSSIVLILILQWLKHWTGIKYFSHRN